MSYLGLTPTEYSSGDQQHRGHITKCGNEHARRLLIEAAWHYQHRPRRARTGPDVPLELAARARRAQVRPHHRHRSLTTAGKRSTVATVAVARELTGFPWAAMTHQPLRDEQVAAARTLTPARGSGGRERSPAEPSTCDHATSDSRL